MFKKKYKSKYTSEKSKLQLDIDNNVLSTREKTSPNKSTGEND